MGCSERKKEIRRRRHRRVKIDQFERKLTRASQSEKQIIAHKLRRLTPGCDVQIERLKLES